MKPDVKLTLERLKAARDADLMVVRTLDDKIRRLKADESTVRLWNLQKEQRENSAQLLGDAIYLLSPPEPLKERTSPEEEVTWTEVKPT